MFAFGKGTIKDKIRFLNIVFWSGKGD